MEQDNGPGAMGEYGKNKITENMSEVLSSPVMMQSSNQDTPGFLIEMGLSSEDPIHCKSCGWDGNGFMLTHERACPVCEKKDFGRGSFRE